MKVAPVPDLLAFEPVIWFHPKVRKEKLGKEEKDKFVRFNVPVDRADPDNDKTTEWAIRVFDTGNAEEYCRWRISFAELVEANGWNTVDQQYTVLQTVLRGEGRTRFNAGFNSVDPPAGGRNRREPDKEEQLRQGYNALSKDLFVPTESAWRRQRSYMRYNLSMKDMPVGAFKRRLLEMNKYLKYFPAPQGRSTTSALSETELVEIMDRAKPPEYQMDILASNYDPYSKSLQEYVEYLERLETKKAIANNLNKNRSHSPGDKPHGPNKGKNAKKANGSDRSNLKCARCGKPGHATNNCWHDPKNEAKKPPKFGGIPTGSKNPKKGGEVNFSAEQMNYLMANFQVLKKNRESNKRRVILSDSESDEEETNHFLALSQKNRKKSRINEDSSDSDYLLPTHSCYAIGRANKKRKIIHNGCELVVQLKNKKGEIVPVRALCDTGTTSTIILSEFVRELSAKEHATTWRTMGGNFTTTKKAVVKFRLPEFSTNKSIAWTAHVDESTNKKLAQYDMIIGDDLMTELGIDLCFSTQEIKWGEESIPMKNRGVLTDRKATKILYHMLIQPPSIMEAEKRHNQILDANYSKVDINEYVTGIKHLTDQEKEQLKMVLEQHPKLFQGGLGTLKIKPISLELKPGAKPYHAKPFAIPKAFEETTRKECKRFEKIGVWYKNSDTEWAAPTFIQPKKTGDVRILTDLRELNKWIVRKPYPLPKIQDMLQKLEQFSYATALDLSMGYYHIPLDKKSQKLCTTILPWGKYSYAKLPMGLSCSPDIFQNIMNELLGDLPYVLVYIDDILILNNKTETAEDHIAKIDQVLKKT
jgi:Reverse transcriptase (RNA-dependent DNA polymerase)